MNTLTLPPPAARRQTAPPLCLALLSHTNVGKTTLARTLLRRDVGEVRDAAGVSQQIERHRWLQAEGGEALDLLDTPGWHGASELLDRLQSTIGPWRWLRREALDRWRRPQLWQQQRDLQTVRDSADLLLYLVNAHESPDDAGYLDAEIGLLRWLDRPVLVVLNQLGAPRPAGEEAAECARWRQRFAALPQLQAVLALDAYSRGPAHEAALLQQLARALPSDAQATLAPLRAAWQAAEQQREAASLADLARLLAELAALSVPLPGGQAGWRDQLAQAVGLSTEAQRETTERALQSLLLSVDALTQAHSIRLLTLHGLDGAAGAAITAQVRAGMVTHRGPANSTRAGLVGGLLSGAATGLMADLASGGLTLGAGMLIGGLTGALGAAGLARGFNLVRGTDQPRLSLSDALLQELLQAGLLRWLTVRHFGRGRGPYLSGQLPAFWLTQVDAAVAAQATALGPLWAGLRQQPPAAAAPRPDAAPEAALESVLQQAAQALKGWQG